VTFQGKILDIISPDLLVPLYNYLKNDHSLRYVAEVEYFNKLPLEEIQRFQLERIRFLLVYVSKNVPYYEQLFKEIGLDSPQNLNWDDYARIPLLTKDIIREEQENLISRQFKESELRKTATGGTTASPIPFYSDWNSMYRKRSATIAFDKWLGYKPGFQSAYLWQARQDMIDLKGLKQKILNTLVHRNLFLAGSPLDELIMEKYYQKLKALSPKLLQAYPGPLEIFAQFLIDNGYHLDIPAISTTAEPLYDHQSRLIEKVFGGKPFNWYGAREAGRIASECKEHNGMHINAYGLYLEINQASYGEKGFGSIILTDLWNIGMPMLRYEIGDVGIMTDKPCACGCQLPRLKDMYGRVNDTFVNSKGQKIPGVWFPNQFVRSCDEIKQMQVLQHGIKVFELCIVKADNFTEDTVRWLKDKLDEFMQEDNVVTITYVPEIPKERSGKVRFCKNLIDLKNQTSSTHT
jgi:phenylacetate-CoA ligase